MTTTTNPNNSPAAQLRDGSIKATIWRNIQDSGKTRYSTELSRSYTDQQGNWHDTNSLSGSELLRAANLLIQAYNQEQTLRSEARDIGSAE